MAANLAQQTTRTARARDFSGIRAEFRLPPDYPTAALVEAEAAVSGPPGPREDATDLPLVTIDPAGAKDLDQALLLRERGAGFRLDYAIADPGHFIRPGGELDAESRRRGQTLYLPDEQVPLHPPLLSEDAASLLPGDVRPAVLWTIDCDADGEPERVRVRRALVRSVAQFDYQTVRDELAAGRPHPSYAPLPRFGRLRRELAVARGAVELQLPEQQAVADGDGGWKLVLRSRVDVEAWNAELSLLTGMCAARLMLDAGVGVLRTLPDPEPEAMASLRRRAGVLGVDWPADVTAARVLARTDPRRPEALAFHVDATRLLRGAGYTVLDGPASSAAATTHAGLGAAYAHVTAPIRRLVDRFASEVCVAVAAGRPVPEWVLAALPELPGLMANSDALASRVERACLAQVEAWMLADRVGEEFPAVVLRGGEVFVVDPPVVARCVGDELPEGGRIMVRLVEADPARRKVAFAPATDPADPADPAKPAAAADPAAASADPADPTTPGADPGNPAASADHAAPGADPGNPAASADPAADAGDPARPAPDRVGPADPAKPAAAADPAASADPGAPANPAAPGTAPADPARPFGDPARRPDPAHPGADPAAPAAGS